jgi:hypothetical protein
MAMAVAPTAAFAQPDLYDPGSVRELRLYFDVPDWRHALDSLYLLGEDERLLGDLVIDGTLLPDVGVRYKGYSSWANGRAKNPFNIKLDEVHDGQDYQGFEKIKLSNVIQDPSFLREVMAYEVARNYMHASRASYADLYVNDTLVGLYTSVEDVGNDFLKDHFDEKSGPFFKGNPPTVDLTGENCNLGDSPGTDSTDYYDLYDIQSDHGWAHLLELIEVLNNAPENIEQVLNVDRTLWMHAFNYALINFDSYVGYAQNYYIYRDRDGLWNPILWDLNMSFASFRLTDASTYWNGFSINQAMIIDPLSHYNGPSVFPRPLLRNLFNNAMYRRMYIAHLRTIITEQFNGPAFRERALQHQALIEAHVQADTNKFYSYQSFLENLDQTVSYTVAYPGLTQLMEGRVAYLNTYPGFTGQPVFGEVAHAPSDIAVGGVLTITVPVTNADTVFLAYRSGTSGVFQRMAMMDDGSHGDGTAGDGVYGALFTTTSNRVEYYVYAENATAGAFSPARATHETYVIQTRLAPGTLVINELMAGNQGRILDPTGASSDWIELYNAGTFMLSTAGLHLSDEETDPTRWALPDRTLAPGEYLVIWADDRTSVGDDHANFKLDAAGETILLAYDADAVLDQVTYGEQFPIYTTGRIPNGTGSFQRLTPTVGGYNRVEFGTGPERVFQIYPNPATTELNAIVDLPGPFEVQVFRSDGSAVTGVQEYTDRHLVQLSTVGLAAGHYVMQVRTADSIMSQPFILLP